MAECLQVLSCRAGHWVENYLLLRKIFFSITLSVMLDQHSQKKSASLLVQLKLTIVGGVCSTFILADTVVFLERKEQSIGGGGANSNRVAESRRKQNCPQ